MLGEQVSNLMDNDVAAGSHQMGFHLGMLSTGTYVCKMELDIKGERSVLSTPLIIQRRGKE
jgi:hypothetical protein